MIKSKSLSFYINIILISSSIQEVAFEWISSWNILKFNNHWIDF